MFFNGLKDGSFFVALKIGVCVCVFAFFHLFSFLVSCLISEFFQVFYVNPTLEGGKMQEVLAWRLLYFTLEAKICPLLNPPSLAVARGKAWP